MKLPSSESATIAEAKITQYLLSDIHEDGKHKAAFFVHFGFSLDEWQRLETALLNHAVTGEVSQIVHTKRGLHYLVEGELETPSGRTPELRSVWAIEEEGASPRFITAYPMKARK